MLWPELPQPRDLSPWLRKLEAPGSCIILTIDAPETEDKRPPVRIGWLSANERQKIRKVMLELSIERGARNEPHFTDPN